MNPVMSSYGMPSGASSGAPYFNGWSPYGGFAQPQQNYGGFGSPYGGFGSPFGSPYGGFSGFGGNYGQPFQQMPMGGGKGGYSSPFSQFQTPNFAAKGGGTQSQQSNSPLTNMSQLPPGSPLPPGYEYRTNQISPHVNTGAYFTPGSIVQIPPGTQGQSGTTNPYVQSPSASSPAQQSGATIPGIPQPNAPIPQAVPPQMMNPVSGPAQMGPGVQPTGILPQQTFNQNRLPGANPIFPKRNMLIGGYR